MTDDSPTLFPPEAMEPEADAAPAPPATDAPATRQTYPCAGPCHGSYVFDRAGEYCYWCKRAGHDVAPLDPTSLTERREA